MCVFSILGYLAESRGVPIQDVVAGGPGLLPICLSVCYALLQYCHGVGRCQPGTKVTDPVLTVLPDCSVLACCVVLLGCAVLMSVVLRCSATGL
eukprot:1334859-Rhodomonas_salina.1